MTIKEEHDKAADAADGFDKHKGEAMVHYRKFIDNKGILNILKRTYSHVQADVIEHGLRTSYIASHLLSDMEEYSDSEKRDVCILAVMHDIGAGREEIRRIREFENRMTWEHSTYGGLFVKYFTPLSKWADAIVHHHTAWRNLENRTDITKRCKTAAQMIHMCDVADLVIHSADHNIQKLIDILEKGSETEFEPHLAGRMLALVDRGMLEGTVEPAPSYLHWMYETPFSDTEIRGYLDMLIYMIDFRSSQTVTHTVSLVSICGELADRMELDTESRECLTCGARIHDLGKIAIPLAILEKPGRLTTEEMDIMRTHVKGTEDILEDAVDERVKQIALRHHEKLDGSGYPLGLTKNELTQEERVMAVADIASALTGIRSYKEAYPKERVFRIMSEMSRDGLIDSEAVEVFERDFDEIMENVREECRPVLEAYESVGEKYQEMLELKKG